MNNIGKIVCIGRNYAEHAKELGNAIPTRPILFMKPASSIRHINENIVYPYELGECHYECELTIQLKKNLKNATLEEVKTSIGAVTLGLDLTLRDLQHQLKMQGHPWERAKCFDGATVLADWLSIDDEDFADFSQINYQLLINNELRQYGDTSLMLFPVYQLLIEASHAFSLQAGDVIMTGTPAGVGKLNRGDEITMQLFEHIWKTKVL